MSKQSGFFKVFTRLVKTATAVGQACRSPQIADRVAINRPFAEAKFHVGEGKILPSLRNKNLANFIRIQRVPVRQHTRDEDIDESVHLATHRLIEMPKWVMEAGREFQRNALFRCFRDDECHTIDRRKLRGFHAAAP